MVEPLIPKDDLSDLHVAVLKIVDDRPGIDAQQIADYFGITYPKALTILDDLRALDFIEDDFDDS